MEAFAFLPSLLGLCRVGLELKEPGQGGVGSAPRFELKFFY